MLKHIPANTYTLCPTSKSLKQMCTGVWDSSPSYFLLFLFSIPVTFPLHSLASVSSRSLDFCLLNPPLLSQFTINVFSHFSSLISLVLSLHLGLRWARCVESLIYSDAETGTESVCCCRQNALCMNSNAWVHFLLSFLMQMSFSDSGFLLFRFEEITSSSV